VEFRSLETFAFGFFSEFLEVADSFWNNLTKKTDFNTANVFVSDFNIKEDLRAEEIICTTWQDKKSARKLFGLLKD
jgi:hypothetical protein